MAPRGHTLPNAATESAREARKSFFCELCQKGYARMNDFEAHEGSYDHQHRKRMKEMKQLIKDPNAAARARAAEQRANEEAGIQSMSLSSLNSSKSGAGASGKKKPVFKSILQPQNAGAAPVTQSARSLMLGGELDPSDPTTANDENDASGAVRNGWYNDRYDPKTIAGCDENCSACRGRCEAISL